MVLVADLGQRKLPGDRVARVGHLGTIVGRTGQRERAGLGHPRVYSSSSWGGFIGANSFFNFSSFSPFAKSASAFSVNPFRS